MLFLEFIQNHEDVILLNDVCCSYVKMRLAFFQMRLALGANAPCFSKNVRRILEKARRILGSRVPPPSRLAQLFVDEGELAGCEAERAVAVGQSREFGHQGGVGLDEALHLLACPHGGVVAKVEVGQFGEGDGFHTGTPPFWRRAFWMTL